MKTALTMIFTAQPSFLEYFDLLTRPDGTSLISSMNGLFQAGAFFGALAISFIGDRFGRKAAITVPAILIVISGALLAGSVHIAMFLVFRFWSGFGSFMLLGSIPLWMTELVPPKNRGSLVDIHSACLLLGYTLAAWTGVGFSRYQTVSLSRFTLISLFIYNFDRKNLLFDFVLYTDLPGNRSVHGEDRSRSNVFLLCSS